VVTELFFGQAFGYVKNGKDVEGSIDAVDRIMPYNAKFAVLPAWARCFRILSYPFSASLRLSISRLGSLLVASQRHVDERLEGSSHRTDMLAKLLSVCKAKSPEFDITDVYVEAFGAL
jgi:hypothetical protein